MTIHVKRKDGSYWFFNEGCRYVTNEKGEWEKIEETEEEKMQHCYDSLIEKVRREEFDRNLKNLIISYLDWDEKEVENIKIVVEKLKDGGHCEMNMVVNYDQDKFTPIDFSLI